MLAQFLSINVFPASRDNLALEKQIAAMKIISEPGGSVRACIAGKTGFTWPPIKRRSLKG
jgi:hypothetical protein